MRYTLHRHDHIDRKAKTKDDGLCLAPCYHAFNTVVVLQRTELGR